MKLVVFFLFEAHPVFNLPRALRNRDLIGQGKHLCQTSTEIFASLVAMLDSTQQHATTYLEKGP